MDAEEKARHDAERAAGDERLSKLAETLGASVSAQAVFGEPVEREGVTVIPVARVRYGFGGGSGRGGGRRWGKKGDGDGEEQFGSGAGGGVEAGPVGYIELHEGHASFTRIADPARVLALLAAPLAALSLAMIVVFARRGRVPRRG